MNSSASWTSASVASCLAPLSIVANTKVQARDYKPSGRFPVVDQGQGHVAGWTDDDSAVIMGPLPLIVFGDHTRAFKFIDFPFARGADGTQLLRPKAGIDPLFFFYACRAIDLPARGYNRHFTVLKEKEIAFPDDCEEQKSIAAVLSKVESALGWVIATDQTLHDAKKAAMHTLFASGLRDGAQTESEYGAVPERWATMPLDDCAVVQTGVTKGRKLGDAIEVPYLRVANVQDGHLDLREVKLIQIRREELNRFLLQDGDVLLTEGGDFDKLGRGFIWRGEIAQCVHQNHVFAVRVNRKLLLPEFLAYLAQSWYGKAYFLKVAHKTTNLASINSTKLKALPVLLPDLDEQAGIVAILDAIDRKIDLHQRKRAVLDELFNSLLHKLMTGEIAVADLDLSALASAQAEVELETKG